MTLQLFQLISLFILLFYILLLLYYWYYWNKPEPDKNFEFIDKPFVSVIIIGRNEEDNIQKCINSIANNNYSDSLFEIIYIDDYSTDKSLEILRDIKYKNFSFYELKNYLDNEDINNYKKKAIEIAISNAQGDIILQTDADTFVGENWILSHAMKYREDKIKFVTAPVFYKSGNSALQQFQKYDLLTTMGVTCAGIKSGLHYMANGANMSFKKGVYSSSASDFASGDDMFLVQAIAKKYPDSIGFLKNTEAIVYTFPEKTLSGFIRQRLRWATKTKGYDSLAMKSVIALVFLMNFIILSNIFLTLFLDYKQIYFTLFLLIFKLIIDILFIKSVAGFFKEKINYLNLAISLLRYPFYIVFIGVLSLFVSKYKWKSRVVR